MVSSKRIEGIVTMKKNVFILIALTAFVLCGCATDVSRTGLRMHPSWDRNKDGINDCEDDGSCDDSIDYTKPRAD